MTLSAADGKLRARLYALDAVKDESLDEQGNFHLQLRLPESDCSVCSRRNRFGRMRWQCIEKHRAGRSPIGWNSD